MITFIAHLHVAPEDAPAIEALLADVRDKTLTHEPGVAWYGFGKSVDTPDTYVVVEVYRDAAAHATHMETAWVRDSIPKSLRLTGGAIEIRQYVSSGTAPVAQRFKEVS